jgi:hypothetical protein
MASAGSGANAALGAALGLSATDGMLAQLLDGLQLRQLEERVEEITASALDELGDAIPSATATQATQASPAAPPATEFAGVASVVAQDLEAEERSASLQVEQQRRAAEGAEGLAELLRTQDEEAAAAAAAAAAEAAAAAAVDSLGNAILQPIRELLQPSSTISPEHMEDGQPLVEADGAGEVAASDGGIPEVGPGAAGADGGAAVDLPAAPAAAPAPASASASRRSSVPASPR